MQKKVLYSTLCFLLGSVFILSGISKLYPIEPFEFSFVETGFFNWRAAPFIARLLIALELFLGFLFIIQLNLKKQAYKYSSILLVFFCTYLTFQILSEGNDGNCGCFGSWIEMTPFEALVKNVVMLIMVALLHKNHDGWQLNSRYSKWITLLILLAIASPFTLNPIALDYSEAYLNKPESNFELKLDSLYINVKPDFPQPPANLKEGKHVIVFLSATCKHCHIAAQKIAIINKRNPEIPFYFVLNGTKEKLKTFYEKTHSELIPYCMLPGRTFIFLAGTSYPSIYLVNNSIVEGSLSYFSLDQSEIEDWLKN